MATIDVRKYFNVDLPSALSANAAAARAIGARYQFVIAGPDGGEWFVDLTAKGPSCKSGKAQADCTVTISDANFRLLCENPEAQATTLFMSGKIKVTGNTGLAMKLGKLLSFVSLPKAAVPAPAPTPKPAPKAPAPAVAAPKAPAPPPNPKPAASGSR